MSIVKAQKDKIKNSVSLRIPYNLNKNVHSINRKQHNAIFSCYITFFHEQQDKSHRDRKRNRAGHYQRQWNGQWHKQRNQPQKQ